MPEVGITAVNDACILESAIYILLKKHFGGHKHYFGLVEIFLEVRLHTELGQACDAMTVPAVSMDTFTMETFLFIATFKTAYYSFYIPVAAILLLCDLPTERTNASLRNSAFPWGSVIKSRTTIWAASRTRMFWERTERTSGGQTHLLNFPSHDEVFARAA